MLVEQINYQTEIVKLLNRWIEMAVDQFGANDNQTAIKLEHPALEKFGDYSTNVALILAKKQSLDPKETANKLKELLDKIVDQEIIKEIKTEGIFVNFYLHQNWLRQPGEEIKKYGQDKTVVIDYSAPNIAKPFGIGHLRSTNIGQSIYNIYKVLGWRTIGDNHIGDWGTQFGKMIAAIKLWGDNRADNKNIVDLEKLYVKFHQQAEKDPKLTDQGRDYFAKLEKGDPEAKRIWQECIEISMKEFDRIYKILDVKIDETHGESFYETMLAEVIGDIKNKGIAKESQGALIVEFDKLPPAMLKKGDGSTTYFTRDMATVKYRRDEWQPDLVIYEIGSEQLLHLQQVFATAVMMGWAKQGQLIHLPHGLIRWKKGKFSTRKGDTIHLEELINKARREAKEIADSSRISKELNQQEREEMIEAVAIGAIKFTDLAQDPKKDIIFDWNRMMSLEGDSAPYLMYCYARCRSVLSMSQKKPEAADIKETVREEMALLRSFYRFEEKIIEAARILSPSVIAEYLLDLARKYNEFYNKRRIIGEDTEEWRLFLTETTASILKKGLALLGIQTVERM